MNSLSHPEGLRHIFVQGSQVELPPQLPFQPAESSGPNNLAQLNPRANNCFAPPMPVTSIDIIAKYLPLAERVNFCNTSKQLGSAFKEVSKTVDFQITHFQEILRNIDPNQYQVQIKELEGLKVKKNHSCWERFLDFKICQIAFRCLFNSSNDALQKKLASPLLSSQEKTTLLGVKICRLLEFAWQNDAALQRNPEIALLFLAHSSNHGRRYLAPELRKERSFMLKAVTLEGLNLREASQELQDDQEIALVAVRQDGQTLHYVSDRLAQDKEVVLAAYAQNARIFENAHLIQRVFEGLSRDRDVALAVIATWSTHYIHPDFFNDRVFMLAAVKKDGGLLVNASQELQYDKEIVLAAVTQNWQVYKIIPKHLKDDLDIILAAIHQDMEPFTSLSLKLRNDPKIIHYLRISNKSFFNSYYAYIGSFPGSDHYEYRPYKYLSSGPLFPEED
jgi:hypothetical protein